SDHHVILSEVAGSTLQMKAYSIPTLPHTVVDHAFPDQAFHAPRDVTRTRAGDCTARCTRAVGHAGESGRRRAARTQCGVAARGVGERTARYRAAHAGRRSTLDA